MNQPDDTITFSEEKKIFFGQRWVQIVIIVLYVVILILVSVLFDLDKISTFVNAHLFLGSLATVVLFALLGLTFIPSEPLSLLLIVLIGPLWTMIITTIGNTLAACVEFFLGGSISQLANFSDKKNKLPFGLSKMPVTSPAFLLIGRMIPALGPKFVSLSAGLYHVPFITYLWTTVVSTLMGAAIISYGGSGVFSIIRK